MVNRAIDRVFDQRCVQFAVCWLLDGVIDDPWYADESSAVQRHGSKKNVTTLKPYRELAVPEDDAEKGRNTVRPKMGWLDGLLKVQEKHRCSSLNSTRQEMSLELQMNHAHLDQQLLGLGNE